MKKLLVVVVLGVVGWFLYTRFVAPPEARICDRLAALCDDSGEEIASCEEKLGEIRSSLGDETMARVEGCVDQSEVCVEAVSCMGAAVTEDALEGAIRGIKRGLDE